MPPISRRGFLVAAAACAVTMTTAAAPASAACTPSVDPTSPLSATGQQGAASATVTVVRLQDVTALHYIVTNVGTAAGTFTVLYTDQTTMLTSAVVTVALDPGATRTGVLYGSLNHKFTLSVGLPDGTTLTIGPVGTLPSCRQTKRKRPTPIYKPGRGMAHTPPPPAPTPTPTPTPTSTLSTIGPTGAPSAGAAPALWPGTGSVPHATGNATFGASPSSSATPVWSAAPARRG